MISSDQIDAYRQQVILSARYSARRWFWGMGLIFLAFITSLCSIFLIQRGNVKGIVGPIGASIVLLFALDQIFTDQIIFYQDKVVKIWHFLGQRTIYYSSAKVTGGNSKVVQRPKWYQITETKDNGRRLWFQIPILYGAQFVPSDTAEEVDVIVDYLTGNDKNRSRSFKKSFLPLDVVCRPNSNEN